LPTFARLALRLQEGIKPLGGCFLEPG